MQKIRRPNLVGGLKEYQTSCAKIGHKYQGQCLQKVGLSNRYVQG